MDLECVFQDLSDLSNFPGTSIVHINFITYLKLLPIPFFFNFLAVDRPLIHVKLNLNHVNIAIL